MAASAPVDLRVTLYVGECSFEPPTHQLSTQISDDIPEHITITIIAITIILMTLQLVYYVVMSSCYHPLVRVPEAGNEL